MINNIKDIIVSRMNNVLIGSFFISVAMMNSRGILTFIFSEKTAKINILKNWQLNCLYDILIPLILTAFYITVIPLLSSVFKKHVANRIYKKEHDAEKDRLIISYQGMEEVAISAARCTPENADLYVKSQISEWLKQKDETLNRLDSCESQLKSMASERDSLNAEVFNLKESSGYYLSLYERSRTSMRGLCESLYDLNEQSSSRLFRKNTESIEYKNHIIAELSTKIIRMFELVNEEPLHKDPLNNDKEWQPPIDERILSILSENIHEWTQKIDHANPPEKSS